MIEFLRDCEITRGGSLKNGDAKGGRIVNKFRSALQRKVDVRTRARARASDVQRWFSALRQN